MLIVNKTSMAIKAIINTVLARVKMILSRNDILMSKKGHNSNKFAENDV